MNTQESDGISFQAGQNVCLQLRQRFGQASWERWEVAGTVRRRRPGRQFVHVIIPRWGEVGDVADSNLVWARAVALQSMGEVAPWVLSGGVVRWVEEGTSLIELSFRGFQHTICLATKTNWGYRLAQRTGPDTFWRMLQIRLEAAGVFKLVGGNLTWQDRRCEPPKPVVIPCGTERLFFQCARTKWKEPPVRWDMPIEGLMRGAEREFYPAGVIPFVSPEVQEQLHLFENPSLTKPRWIRGRREPSPNAFRIGEEKSRPYRPPAPPRADRERPPAEPPGFTVEDGDA